MPVRFLFFLALLCVHPPPGFLCCPQKPHFLCAEEGSRLEKGSRAPAPKTEGSSRANPSSPTAAMLVCAESASTACTSAAARKGSSSPPRMPSLLLSSSVPAIASSGSLLHKFYKGSICPYAQIDIVYTYTIIMVYMHN